MSLVDLLWYLPLMLAIAIVLGASGRRGVRTIARSVWGTFLALSLGVLAVGLVVHVVAVLFS